MGFLRIYSVIEQRGFDHKAANKCVLKPAFICNSLRCLHPFSIFWAMMDTRSSTLVPHLQLLTSLCKYVEYSICKTAIKTWLSSPMPPCLWEQNQIFWMSYHQGLQGIVGENLDQNYGLIVGDEDTRLEGGWIAKNSLTPRRLMGGSEMGNVAYLYIFSWD